MLLCDFTPFIRIVLLIIIFVKYGGWSLLARCYDIPHFLASLELLFEGWFFVNNGWKRSLGLCELVGIYILTSGNPFECTFENKCATLRHSEHKRSISYSRMLEARIASCH